MGQVGFELGDKVKVIRVTKSYAAEKLIGKEGIITLLHPSHCVLDIDPSKPTPGGIYYDEIELVRLWDK